MGFTIKEKAFLLHYFRKRVKQESEDWPYFVPPSNFRNGAKCSTNYQGTSLNFHKAFKTAN
jgi:hypothetical protein